MSSSLREEALDWVKTQTVNWRIDMKIEYRARTKNPSWFASGSYEWCHRPEGFYFTPDGFFADGDERCCGPFASEADAKTACEKWDSGH